MYPVPYLFPPIYAKGRSKSPKKLRPRKQRSPHGDFPQGQCHERSALASETVGTIPSASTSRSQNARSHEATHNPQRPAPCSGIAPLSAATNSVNSVVAPFTSQFDEVARQTAHQTSIKKACLPQDDLTTIRNVAARDTGNLQGYHTLPSRRRPQHYIGNGLYGGRGSVGVPLHATAPFPAPVPPMGRPADECAGYQVGTGACGIFDIGKAFEHGGRQACNACEPDH